MTRRLKFMLAIGLGLAAAGGAGVAIAQADLSAQLRASGEAGEQADGYMGIVGSAPANVRSEVEQVNIKRRAAYTELAAKRGVKIEEVAASTACEIFASRVGPGEYYRLQDGIWRKRDGNTPVPRPGYCG